MDDPVKLHRRKKSRTAMGLSGGQLVANPIPTDAEIPQDQIEPIINKAQGSRGAGCIYQGRNTIPVTADI